MANGEVAERFPSEEEIEIQIKTAGAEAGVSPFDPDFLLFALPFAFVVDAFDIILELTGFLVIPKLVGIAIDVFVFFVLIFPGWMYWRLKRIEESKKARQVALTRGVQKAIKRLTKLQKIGKVSPQVFERYMRRYGAQMGSIGRAAARIARRPLVRAVVRGALILLGEIAWLIGLLPLWTIGVILTLREK
mgnify:CR=1 FL=1